MGMDTEQKIQEGFNDGYLLAKHKPDVFSTLQKGIVKGNEDPYVEGLFKGAEQAGLEMSRGSVKGASKDPREEQRQKIRENLKQQDKDKDLGRSR